MDWGSSKSVCALAAACLLTACAAGNCPEPKPAPAAKPEPPVAKGADAAKRAASAVEPMTPERALERLFSTNEIDADWFDEAFRDAVPVVRIARIAMETHARFGALRSVSRVEDAYEAVFERGVQPCQVYLDEQGRITGLWFQPPRLLTVELDDTVAALRALPGKVSALLVGPDGEDVAAIEPDAPLAVGSAFKLAILDAVKRRVKAKKATWKTVVALEARHKSLPSGDLRLWPDNTPLTLATAAGAMISESDNTAADLLLDWVGRGEVEKISPRNAPFLSTREAFVLKARDNAGLLERYRKAGEGERREVLGETAGMPLPTVGGLEDAVTGDVEWFFTARELCAILGDVADLPAFEMNPGLAVPAEFDAVAYKGGSEPGVLNFSTRVTKGDRSACVVATWNSDDDVDENRLVAAYQALLAAARDRLAPR